MTDNLNNETREVAAEAWREGYRAGVSARRPKNPYEVAHDWTKTPEPGKHIGLVMGAWEADGDGGPYHATIQRAATDGVWVACDDEGGRNENTWEQWMRLWSTTPSAVNLHYYRYETSLP